MSFCLIALLSPSLLIRLSVEHGGQVFARLFPPLTFLTICQKFKKLMHQYHPQDADGRRDVLLEACMHAMQVTSTADVFRDGFRRAGLHPLCLDMSLSHPCISQVQLSHAECEELEELRRRRKNRNIGIGGGIMLPEELKCRFEERERQRKPAAQRRRSYKTRGRQQHKPDKEVHSFSKS